MMTPKRARRMKRASRSHASALPSVGIVRTTMATSSQCARSAARRRFATTRTATSSVTKIVQMIQFATVANVCQPSDFASASSVEAGALAPLVLVQQHAAQLGETVRRASISRVMRPGLQRQLRVGS